MLSFTDAQAEMATGTCFVCSMCERYWEGKDIVKNGGKIDGQICTAPEFCGSPLVSDVFHLYRGPIVNFEERCFVCGERSAFSIRVRDIVRPIGVCTKHVKVREKEAPVEQKKRPGVIKFRVEGSNGS